jgi:hypothetical protein
MSQTSRARLNLALVGLVALLAALAWFRPGIKHDGEATPLVKDAGSIKEVRLALAGKPEIRLVRDGEAWRMLAPRAFPADAAMMQGFLDGLGAPVEDAFAAAGMDLAKYGLDKPLARLWLDGVEYDFGAVQPINKQRYLLSAGRVMLVDDYLFYRVAHDSYGWLDKHLLPEGARITALQLPHATLTLDAKGAWQIAPTDKTLTPEALQAFVGRWHDAYAMGMAPIGKGKPEGELAFALASVKDPLRFQLLDDADYLVLARPDLGIEYQLDISEAETLLAPSAATH